ncbi:MAG: hypothetical protein JWO98_5311 [Frankiales bacterium]|nr:hypothetical protein [Frankiales bacterium]
MPPLNRFTPPKGNIMNDNTKSWLISAAVAAVTVAALAGCSASPSIVSAPAKTSHSAAATTPPPAKATNPTFGMTAKWPGVTLTAAAPVAFTPSEYAAGADQAADVVVTITVTNTGTANFDPSLAYITASSGGVEASKVFDTDAGINSAPSTPILPGASVTWKVGLSVADPATLTLSATPSVGTDAAILFTN